VLFVVVYTECCDCELRVRFLWKDGSHDDVIVASIPVSDLHSIFEVGKLHSSLKFNGSLHLSIKLSLLLVSNLTSQVSVFNSLSKTIVESKLVCLLLGIESP